MQPTDDHTTILLKELHKRGMTQVKLAELSGIDKRRICTILSGKRTMTVNQAVKFVKVLKGITARELLVAQVDFKLGEYGQDRTK